MTLNSRLEALELRNGIIIQIRTDLNRAKDVRACNTIAEAFNPRPDNEREQKRRSTFRLFRIREQSEQNHLGAGKYIKFRNRVPIYTCFCSYPSKNDSRAFGTDAPRSFVVPLLPKAR